MKRSPFENSLKNAYTPSKNNSIEKNLSVHRNVGSVLSKEKKNKDGKSVASQCAGAHVTALNLVLNGFLRILDKITEKEVKELSNLKNRDSLRGRRSKLYDYVSAIAVLDPDRSRLLYDAVDKILENYNTEREKKVQFVRMLEIYITTSFLKVILTNKV